MGTVQGTVQCRGVVFFFVIKLILIKILFGKALRLSIWSHVSHEIVVYVRTCVYVLKC